MELANELIDNAPDFATTNITDLMGWQAKIFELMPDKETAADTHYHHIRERYADMPHGAQGFNADAMLRAWKLLMKRFD